MMMSTASPAATPPSQEEITNVVSTTKEQFQVYSKQFLDALGETYPACEGIKEMRLKYQIAIEHAMTPEMRDAALTSLIDNYHATMKPFYGRVQQRDASLFAEAEQQVELLSGLKVSEKWASADQDTRECIYSYLDLVNQYAQCYVMYKNIPNNMMSKIQGMAMRIASDMQEGTTNLEDVNIMQLGQAVVSEIDQDELQSFATSMMADPEGLQNMMSMMGNMGAGMGGQ